MNRQQEHLQEVREFQRAQKAAARERHAEIDAETKARDRKEKRAAAKREKAAGE